jgi:hypothetical protein
MTVTIEEFEKLEFNLVAALADLPASQAALRPQALEVLEKLRAQKRALLARSPDVLRKGSRLVNHPDAKRTAVSWRGLPIVEGEVTAMVKAARDRQSEERRLAKTSGQATPERALAALKQTLRQPITGDRALVNFLTRGR